MKNEFDTDVFMLTAVPKQEKTDTPADLVENNFTEFDDHFDDSQDDFSNKDDDSFKQSETGTKSKDPKSKKPYKASEKFRCWCGVQMYGKKKLRDHQIARHEEVPLSARPRCAICGKDFKIQAYLNTHIKYKHENQKQERTKVSCSVCGKLLVKGALNSHEERHKRSKDSSNAQNFVCDLCSHKTSAKNYMQQHIERIHLKLKK